MARLVVGLIFIAVPVLELALLIRIGQSVGVWPTVALVMATALSGAFIISRQSFGVLRRTLEALQEGEPPVAPVVDGLFLMIAGALLLTPGLITDIVALLLLVPPIRRAIARWCLERLARNVHVEMHAHGPGTGPRPPTRNGPVIEGEFQRLDDGSHPPPRPPPSA